MITELGSWIPAHGFNIPVTNVWSRRSLNGHQLRGATVQSKPYITYIEDNCTRKDCFKGIYADIWHELQSKMNFTYTMNRVYIYGQLTKGSWNGMVRMLKDGEVDITPVDSTITQSRSTVIEFLPRLDLIHEKLFLWNPVSTPNSQAYIEPFTIHSWLGVVIFVIVVPIILRGIFKYSKDVSTKKYAMSDCLCFALNALLMRDHGTEPRSGATRTAYASIVFGGILVYYLWEAMLISYLSVKKVYMPFRTLEEFEKTSNYKLVVAKGFSQLDMFRSSKEYPYNDIWAKKMRPYAQDFPLVYDLVRAMKNDPFSVVYVDAYQIDNNESYLSCDVVDTGVNIRTTQLAWSVPKSASGIMAFRNGKMVLA